MEQKIYYFSEVFFIATNFTVTHTFPIYCGIIDEKLDSKIFHVHMPYLKKMF